MLSEITATAAPRARRVATRTRVLAPFRTRRVVGAACYTCCSFPLLALFLVLTIAGGLGLGGSRLARPVPWLDRNAEDVLEGSLTTGGAFVRPPEHSSAEAAAASNEVLAAHTDEERERLRALALAAPRVDLPSHWPTNVVHFMHVSDVHLSEFDRSKSQRFEQFLRIVRDVVRPALVVASGDITDAKVGAWVGDERGQRRREWEEYRTALSSHGMLRRDFWLDIRGNHDAFGVSQQGDDLFHRFSVQRRRRRLGLSRASAADAAATAAAAAAALGGTSMAPDEVSARGTAAGDDEVATSAPDASEPHAEPEHYTHTVRTEFGEYQFVAIDAAPRRAPPRHFFGHAEAGTRQFLREVVNPRANRTIVFGHYPLAVAPIAVEEADDAGEEAARRSLVDEMGALGCTAYLAGHLHELGGITPELYARHQPSRLLELVVADLKNSGVFRIFAFDHDLFSFVDVQLPAITQAHGDEHYVGPYVLVTLPPDARALAPTSGADDERALRVLRSTHVRFLAFGSSPLERARLVVNGELVWEGDLQDDPLAGLYSHALQSNTPARGEKDADDAAVDTAAPGTASSAPSLPPLPPLYTIPWTPPRMPGLSHFDLTVWDARGHMQRTVHLFSVLSDTDAPLPPLSHALLSLSWTHGILLATDAALALMLALLLLGALTLRRLRRTNTLAAWRRVVETALEREDALALAGVAPSLASFLRWRRDTLLYAFVGVAERTRTFRMLVIAIAWLRFGPLLGGPLFSTGWGIMFHWGVLDLSTAPLPTLLPHSDMPFLALPLTLGCLWPLMWLLATHSFCALVARHRASATPTLLWSLYSRESLPVLGLFGFLCFAMNGVVLRSYGPLTWLLSPAFLWATVIAWWLLLRELRDEKYAGVLVGGDAQNVRPGVW